MRNTYWMLGVYAFLIISLVCFIIYPATAILAGFLMGFISIYRGLPPDAGTLAIDWSNLTWQYWQYTLFGIFLLSILFVIITRAVQRSSKFRWIKPKNNKTFKHKQS
ncbi:MAG: hypothetical protein KJ955_04325 [Nanoarchaeota archaeon]|nr:hypothetical protein [Nanoarchaeota archaeon]